MGFFLFVLILYILISISLFFVFPKVSLPAARAIVPVVNLLDWCEFIGRKKAHAAWLLFPIVNIFIIAGMCIDLVRSFGKYQFWHSVLSVVCTPLFFIYLGLNRNEKYLGPTLVDEAKFKRKVAEARKSRNTTLLRKLENNNPYRKSSLREWTESIIFAVFAAAFIRMFLIEMYKIPTSSMEGSLLVGDFLCVSKAHYGIRTPMTIAMIPLLHNRIPGIKKESYWEKPSLSYYRLPALQQIRRNDPVVFNYPEGDSVFIMPGRTYSIYDIRRMGLDGNPQFTHPITRPMDKMDHYIKRCIAIPGDTLEIRDKQVFINGSLAETPKYLQYSYILQARGTPLNERKLKEWGINVDDAQPPVYNLSEEHLEKIRSLENVEITPVFHPARPLFPYDPNRFNDWTVDNYGPVWVPKKGVTIDLNPDNISLYYRVISTYEGNDLQVRNGEIILNGTPVSTYTFQMDYYWMMGDNRHNSEDSRVWGFVPENHVVGKPLFIWFSTRDGNIKNGINWNRLFTGANKK